jgi:hypothetical protein
MNALFATIRDIFRESASISLTLFKIMIPIIVLVKIIKELGLIQYLALPLAPVMKLVGLPPEMGLVWAMALVNNIYGGIIVLASLIGDHPLTVAQATVLGAMLLVAHGLPLEIKIVGESGPRMWFQVVLRVVGALVLGFLLDRFYALTGMHQGPAAMLWTPEGQASASLAAWALGELKNLCWIFVIIAGLVAFMRVLDAIRLTDLMNRLLGPLLKLMGIGPKASSITIIGLTMGLSYGGGLIIHEARSGNLDQSDVFFSLSLMGLCHSLFEDTLLLMLIGGAFSGLFWGRLLFALVVVALLVRLTAIIGRKRAESLFWRPLPTR